MIELGDVRFGHDLATPTLDVPSLRVEPGLTLVLGQDGSSKSMLLRLIAGVEAPQRGTITVGSHDLWKEEVAAQRLIAYMPESPELTPYATIYHIRTLVAGVRGAPPVSIVTAVDRVGLFELSNRTVRELSMGRRRRAMLATALVGDACVVILDDPLETLDAAMRQFVVGWVGELRATGATVLVATHDLPVFESIAGDEITVIAGHVSRPRG